MKLIVSTLVILAMLAMPVAFASSKQAPEKNPWPVGSSSGFTSAAVTDVGKSTLRLHGSNRYETASAVADLAWSYENTIIVYLATGENYADALGLGPSTFALGPLLLVGKNSLPETTRSQLARLGPCGIVAVGGAGVISDEVLNQADAYTEPEACGF